MKKYGCLFFIMFAFIVLFPFNVSAVVSEVGDNVYTVKTKQIKDYVCNEIKEHSLTIASSYTNKIMVYDETSSKDYLIDFLKIGVCQEGSFSDDIEEIPPFEFVWKNNKLYLQTYSLDTLYLYSKTLDKELDVNSSYTEKKEDGYYHVYNPTVENLSNYYEFYLFELATDNYDESTLYYEIVKNEYTFAGETEYYEEAVAVELDESGYETNKYYVLAQPEKEELIVEFEVDTFVVPKEKSGLENDLTVEKNNFLFKMEFGNKEYYVFEVFYQNYYVTALFDEKGNYQTLGLDTLLIYNLSGSMDNENLTLITKIGNKDYLMILDNKLNLLVKYDISEIGDDLTYVGHNDNSFYFLTDPSAGEILEINTYYLLSNDNQKFNNNDLTIKFSGPLNELKNVKLYDQNNKEVTLNSKNYTLKSGSTIIILKKEYLSTLSNGKYNLKVEYNDGGYSSTIFSVSTTEVENPETFDGIVNSILMTTVSLIGLVCTTIYLKQKNKVRA